MKPLYWKLLVILGAIIVGACLIIPKSLRKNQHVDSAHTSEQIMSNKSDIKAPTSVEPIEFGFHEVVQADKLVTRMCLEDNVCPRDKKGYPQKDKQGAVLVSKTPIINNLDLSRALVSEHPQSRTPIVNIVMNAVGAKKFCEFTNQNKGQPFAIVLDGEVISVPYINAAICGGTGFIEGGFTLTEAKNIARALNAGTRPVKSRVND